MDNKTVQGKSLIFILYSIYSNLEPTETKEPEKQETPEDFVVPDADGM